MFSILPADEQKTAALAKREGASLPVVALTLTVNGVEDGYVMAQQLLQSGKKSFACGRLPRNTRNGWCVLR